MCKLYLKELKRKKVKLVNSREFLKVATVLRLLFNIIRSIGGELGIQYFHSSIQLLSMCQALFWLS
jgi:hypothetical protein